jgi:hypothetical protein
MVAEVFDPATAPYPYSTPEGEPYVFPLADFPTRETVEAWMRWSDRDYDPDDWSITRGQQRVHDHGEDEACQLLAPDALSPDTDSPCPQSRVIEGWLVG